MTSVGAALFVKAQAHSSRPAAAGVFDHPGVLHGILVSIKIAVFPDAALSGEALAVSGASVCVDICAIIGITRDIDN